MFAFTRSKTLVGFILAACLLVPILSGIGAPAPKDTEIKKLQKERLATAVKTYEMAKASFESGQSGYGEVAGAHTALLNARLEVCDTKADRIQVRGEMVQTAKQMTEHVKAQLDSGNTGTIELLKAQAQLLDVQIGLEKEKAGL